MVPVITLTEQNGKDNPGNSLGLYCYVSYLSICVSLRLKNLTVYD